jgi:thiamine biosynthesis lipoprotein
MKSTLFHAIAIFTASFMAITCALSAPPAHETEYVLGTVCTVRLLGGKGETKNIQAQTFKAIFAELHRLDNILSANTNNSELARVNNAAGKTPVAVSDDLFTVLSRALFFASHSDDNNGKAVFDPTIGPLVKAWSIGTEQAHIPTQEVINASLALVNWRDVVVDAAAKTVYLKRPGMRLDLGGIAKGYAADKAVAIAKNCGIQRAIIDLGGNIFALGEKADGAPFRIGVQNPAFKRGEYAGVVFARNQTLVTSGVYERFFILDDKRYHHILSTETGYPVDNGLASVTIIGRVSMDADALSTTLFALGEERGTALLSAFPDTGAIFIYADGTIHTTSVAAAVWTRQEGREQ